MLDTYILDENHVPITEPDFMKWVKRREAMRRMAQNCVGDVIIRTVFLGIDNRSFDAGSLWLFETMVFGGPLDQEMERYITWDEAVAGHARMLERVKEAAGREDSQK